MVQGLHAISISHHHRETNRLVYRIAASGTLQSYEEVDVGSLSHECIKIIEEDASGKLFDKM